ncbi:MAG TPA: hypothetical protein VFI86_08175 [Burkholderiales bacterium]|nr:hypothetical protein [Burkholderiales bacterium]
MRLFMLAAAVAAAAALAGCDRNRPTPTPTPKTSSAGGSAPVRSSANDGAGNREDDRNTGDPVSQQVDPNRAEQHRDFRQSGDAAGPKSADTAPMTRNK